MVDVKVVNLGIRDGVVSIVSTVKSTGLSNVYVCKVLEEVKL